MSFVRRRLARVMRSELIDRWLDTPHQSLSGRTPRQALQAGDIAAVAQLLDSLEIPPVA